MIIIVEEGVVQHVLNIPEGVSVEVHDYDVEGHMVDGEQIEEVEKDSDGVEFVKINFY
jgi:hypothetical protein